MSEIQKTFKECLLDNAWFKILSLASIVLIFISLLLPPQGVIDPSVISASGELLGWGALFSVIKAIDRGKSINVKHGDTEIIFNGQRYKLEQEEEQIDNNE